MSRVLEIPDRAIHRVLFMVLLGWGIGLAVYSAATAHQRCVDQLDETLRALRQAAPDASLLNADARDRCFSDLHSPEAYRRWAAAAKLGEWADHASVRPIIASMQDDTLLALSASEDEEERWVADYIKERGGKTILAGIEGRTT